MPIYHFRNKETDDVIEAEMRMSELDTFKADNPHLKQVILSAPVYSKSSGAPTQSLSERVASKHKGWGEVLSKIGEQNPNSQVANDFHRNKSIARIKAEKVVEKHAKIQAAQRNTPKT